ncbi:DNA polymerase III subunit delta [Patescibacteria group bacterium]|nr:DNA polymerase III subunit delta [Patescibacteria group bacterium]
MIIFLYGGDAYRIQQKLTLLKEKFISVRSQSKLNLSTFDLPKLNINELRVALLSKGLFSEKRMTILHNALTKKSNELFRKTIAHLVENYSLLQKDQKNIIIFQEGEIKLKDLGTEQKKLFSLLKREKFYPEFRPLTKAQAKKWAQDYAEKKKIKIEKRALDYIVDSLGNDLWAVKNELDKIKCSFKPTTKISLEKIKTTINTQPEENIWNLIEAFGQRDKKQASKLLIDQIEAGMGTDYMISMLAYQYRTILRVKSYLERKKRENFSSSQAMAKELGLHPYVFQKALNQQKKYDLSELKDVYRNLLEIDILKKTRQINAEILLNLLILKN